MAGAGYKLFTTGQVLTAAEVNTYLMEQTIMVFNNAAARDTALSGVLAQGMQCFLKDTNTMQYYSGSAWVTLSTGGDITSVTAGTGISGGGTSGDVTITNSMATAITTKGDLVPGTGSGTFSRLAAGSDGSTLVADSSTSTGLRWQPSTGRNFALNSDFTIWQRGTSITPTSNGGAYCADRWYITRGSNTSITATQQTAGNLSVTPNQAFRYYARVQRTAGTTTTSNVDFGQMFETSQVTLLAGQTVTFSAYIRKGANFSATSDALSMQIIEGTGTDQKQMDGGYTGSNTVVSTAKTLTSSWQRFSVTGTIATTSTEITIKFSYTPTGTAGASDFFEVTGVQLELGSVPTAWNLATGTLAGELAACQRYYYRVTGQSAGQSITNGNNESTTVATAFLPFPVTMRTAPTALEQDGTAANYYVRHQATTTNCSSVPTFANGSKTGADISFIVASGLTAGNGNKIGMNSTSAYLGWSAEL